VLAVEDGGLWDRNIVALTVYNAFRGFAVGGFMTLLPMYMKFLGYSMNSIGGIISVSSIVLSLFLPFIGYLIDRFGSRLMVSLTGLLLLAGTLGAMVSRGLLGLGFAYGLFFFSFLAGQPARMSFLASSVGASRMGEAVGLTSSVFSASRTAGPLVAGVLAGVLGYRVAFASLALSTLVGLTGFVLLSEYVPGLSGGTSVRGAYRYLIRPPRGFAGVLGFVSLDRFAWSLWYPILSAHLYASGFSEDEVGVIITTSGVVQTVLMPFAGRWTDRIGAWLALAGSEILGVASAVLYATPDSWLRVLAAAVFVGASIAWWIPSYNSLIAKVAGGSGAAYAAANTARSLLGSPAPITGGYLYDLVAPWAPFAVSTVLLTAASAYSYFILRRVEESSNRYKGKAEEAVSR